MTKTVCLQEFLAANLREEVRDHHSWYCNTEASTPSGTESGLWLRTHRQTA